MSSGKRQQENFREAVELIERKNDKLFRRVGSKLQELIDQLPEHSDEIMDIESLFHEINLRSQELAYHEGYKQGLLQRGWFKPIFQTRQKIMTK
ncbi:hypothetical protein AAXB25_34785 [Paenibacillus lautus]|uniref:hypothetical protein n=1 Tax=Paenibacillus lautus TaxID=1401 RepID=UPI003D27E018